MKRIPNTKPGEILREDFLEPMGITAYKLAKDTNIDQTRISEIINGKRAISVDTALRLGKFFGVSAEFWMNLQNQYDLYEKKEILQKELQKIKTFVFKESKESKDLKKAS